eukprot:UN14275
MRSNCFVETSRGCCHILWKVHRCVVFFEENITRQVSCFVVDKQTSPHEEMMLYLTFVLNGFQRQGTRSLEFGFFKHIIFIRNT